MLVMMMMVLVLVLVLVGVVGHGPSSSSPLARPSSSSVEHQQVGGGQHDAPCGIDERRIGQRDLERFGRAHVHNAVVERRGPQRQLRVQDLQGVGQ